MRRWPPPRATGALQAVGRALRESPGWFIGAAGAVLLVLGWYGVSGEDLTARQLPYLASATAPGAALVIAGAVLLAGHRTGRAGPSELTDRRIEQLHALLVSEAARPPAEPPGQDGPPLAVPDGTLYHRRDCPLVAGKPRAEPVDAESVRARGLAPCPVCEPTPPPGALAEPG